MNNLILFVLIGALLSVLYAAILIILSLKGNHGQGPALDICQIVKKTSQAYLLQYYNVLALVLIGVFLLLGFIARDWVMALAFLAGALFNCLVAYISLVLATKINSRLLAVVLGEPRKVFGLAIRGGLINGLLVVGIGLLLMVGFYALYSINFVTTNALIGLIFGVGLVALLTQVSSGIYIQAANRAIGLVKKAELDFKHQEPHNISLVASSLGKVVNGSLVITTGLLETYVLVLAAIILLGLVFFKERSVMLIYPLVLTGITALTTIVNSSFIKAGGQNNKPSWRLNFALFKGILATVFLTALVFYPVNQYLMRDNAQYSSLNLYLCIILGLVLTILIMVVAFYYSSRRYRLIDRAVEAIKSGQKTENIGTSSTNFLGAIFWPVVMVGAVILIAYSLAGAYGVGLSVLGLLSMAGIMLSIGSSGSIIDNTYDLLRLTNGFSHYSNHLADHLDRVSHDFKMIARTYAVMAAGLTAWLMFIVYSQEMVQAGNYVSFQLDEPLLLIGLLIGGLLPYLFKSFSWRAALRVSRKCGQSYLKKEAGTGLFAYEQCVLSGVKGSLVGMIWPVLLALLAPIAFWFLGSFVGGNINQKLLGSLLIGSIISGFLMTLSMVIGGSAQNNSQKSVKTDNSDEAITIGPAISSLIKMLNIIALLIIGLLML